MRQRGARAWRREGVTPGFGGLVAAPARIEMLWSLETAASSGRGSQGARVQSDGLVSHQAGLVLVNPDTGEIKREDEVRGEKRDAAMRKQGRGFNGILRVRVADLAP